MGTRQKVSDFAQNQFLRMSTRLRTFGDLFNPSRAGISEAVVPPTSKFIGKTPAELHLRKSHGISLLAINRDRSEEHTSELQSLMRISYAVFCLKKKTT